MSLFGADQVYTCLEKVYMVYTGLPPDVITDLPLNPVDSQEGISLQRDVAVGVGSAIGHQGWIII